MQESKKKTICKFSKFLLGLRNWLLLTQSAEFLSTLLVFALDDVPDACSKPFKGRGGGGKGTSV